MDDDPPPPHDGEEESTSPSSSRRDSDADGPSTLLPGGECDVAVRLRNAQQEQPAGDDQHDEVDDNVDCASVPDAGAGQEDGVVSRCESPPSEAVELIDERGAATGECADAASDDGGGVNTADEGPCEAPSSEMRELMDEVASIQSVLRGPATDATDEILLQIRSWGHRTAGVERSDDKGSSSPMTARLIPMAAPTGEMPVQGQVDGSDVVSLLRVVSFEDGVYRGQVVRSTTEETLTAPGGEEADAPAYRYLPHGWGIATSHKGLRRVGQWRDGEQVGVGSLQSAVFLYDGEWRASSGPSGYGIGTFAFGATFVGCWHNGKPYGLGRLQTFGSGLCEHGWFYGTRCLQPVGVKSEEQLHVACVERHLPVQRFDEQPHRGLFLVGQILENGRLMSLRSALKQWRGVSCDHALELARRRRAATMAAWVEAHAAEHDAIAWHISDEMQAFRVRMASVLNEVATGRQKHTRVQRIREFHTNKLNTAIFQRDLARRCVLSQEESIALMEEERAEVSTLLEEATQAQAECQRLAEQQQLVKRQIENATVKINALRQQIRHREGMNGQQQHYQQELYRNNLKTPATPSYAKAIHGPRHVKVSQSASGEMDTHSELPFVCDVSGCSCGIPRHVFTRVAAALNGD